VYWDLLPGNTAAVNLAESYGFSPVRHLKRMARGQAPPEQRSLIYALSGFETG
jgi:RimJ/RimL family protein N-acetyltransferase